MSLLLCVSLWTCLWTYRRHYNDPTADSDACIIAAVEIWHAIRSSTSGFDASLLIICGHVLILLFMSLFATRVNKSAVSTIVADAETSSTPLPQPWAKPAVIPSRTNHTRFIPQKHSFSYSYLLVGVPIGWTGRAGVLSIESSKLGLLTIKSRDYLGRVRTDKDLRLKLEEYLRSQGQNPERFPYAYLVTAPRVLGYSFNPVSFWYLFSPDRNLRAMILEVNNTFDERRLYFLETSSNAEVHASKSFANSWTKDFHVSPFNDRDGSYSLVADNIGLETSDMIKNISNTITLLSSEKQSKLVARIFSTESPLDASSIGLIELMRLVKAYGWVGFVTFPRIIREAWKLYFTRNLDVFFRPEVAQGTIGRTPTAIERNLEDVFRCFLATAVEQYHNTISLIYKPAPGIAAKQWYEFGKVSTDRHALVITVLTPAFYSRYVHYRNHGDAISEEGLCTDVRNRTVHVSDPELLMSILGQWKQKCNYKDTSKRIPCMDLLRWRFLDMLRCKPGAPSFPNETAIASLAALSSSCNGLSALDQFATHSTCDGWLYRRNVTQLFLATRFFAGFPGIVDLLDVIWRICMICLGMSLVLIPDDISHHNQKSQAVAYATKCVLVGTVHYWAMLKGFTGPGTMHTALLIARGTHVLLWMAAGCRR